MGQEIDQTHFKQCDFQRFRKALQRETELLQSWQDNQQLADSGFVIGFELESWLINQQQQPAPINQSFISHFNSELVTPELAKFNVEFNTHPTELRGQALSQIERELKETWQQGQQIAHQLDGCQLLAIGILPTVKPDELCMANMTEMKRYRALNEQVLRLRQGEPLTLNIQGRQHLQHIHRDLMLESAATSFQVHLQTPLAQASRHYNASKIASAPIIAIAANSPYLFNHDLWDESRIPLFEQAVEVSAHPERNNSPHQRVTFGEAYLDESMLECFQRNLNNYEVILPLAFEGSEHNLEHLRLHNGTIWRWNRPLVGFDQQGRVHLRIEHRPLPAGPTIVDMVANAAFYFGVTHALAKQLDTPQQQLPFNTAKENFYHAAKLGLESEITWLDNQKWPVQALILDQLLPLAKEGLTALKIASQDIDRYLGIIEQRARNKQNGAHWQRSYILKHGCNYQQLTKRYIELQKNEQPVHQWPL